MEFFSTRCALLQDARRELGTWQLWAGAGILLFSIAFDVIRRWFEDNSLLLGAPIGFEACALVFFFSFGGWSNMQRVCGRN